jgi:cell division protein FtsQ
MKPVNRRLAKQKLPPEVLESEGLFDPEGIPSEAPVALSAAGKKDRKTRASVARIAAHAKVFLGAILVVAMSVVVAWAARRYVTTSRRFAVGDIVVAGAAKRAPADIVGAADIPKGTNIFAVDLDVVRARILSDPWVADAKLSRRLPNTIRVDVVERSAKALVVLGDTYLATSEGDIFKGLEPGDPYDLPVITGLSVDAFADDREGAKRQVRSALDLIAEYTESAMGQKAPLQEIHLGGDGTVSLVVGKNAVTIALGQPPFRRKLVQAARVVAEVERRGARADAIMVDNVAHPERVVVRMR